MFLNIYRYAMLALSVMGSATLLFSCSNKPSSTSYDNETLMTESSENRTIIMMENGKRSYTFTSPLMEGYRLAANPYQEFRRGIYMTTYTDSLSLIDATITANYAIYYERQKLWEAKGNVVIIKRNRKDGDTTVTGLTEVYTQQLFWNATAKKIYSNVDTKVLQPDGWHFGVGFDADDDLKNIHFRKYSSEMEFDMSQPPQQPQNENSEGDKASEKRSDDKGAKRNDTKSRAERDDNRPKDNRGGFKPQGGRTDRQNISPVPVTPAPTVGPKSQTTPSRPSGARQSNESMRSNAKLQLNTELSTTINSDTKFNSEVSSTVNREAKFNSEVSSKINREAKQN